MLAPDQWVRVRSLLEEIMARPAEERAAYLAAAHINEPDIRREVESLLRAHDDAGDFLEATPRVGPDPLKQQQLGDFEIGREIGRGGMGVVYEARQMSLNRQVALKVLAGGLGLTPQAVQRFHREAEAAAKLHHTNIVPIYATGETGRHPLLRDGTDRGAIAGPGHPPTAPGTDRHASHRRPPLATGTPMHPRLRRPDLTWKVPGPSSSGVGLSSSSLGSGSGYFDTRGPDDRRGGRRPGLRPPTGRDPPGHQAIEPAPVARRPAERQRLRAGPDAGAARHDHHRRDRRHAAVHVARADHRRANSRGPPHRHLLAGGDALRAADAAAAVRGGAARPGAGPDHPEGADAAPEGQRQGSGGPGDDLPEGDGEGPRSPLPDGRADGGRPAAVRQPLRHPGAARRARRAVAEVGQAEPGIVRRPWRASWCW